MDAISNPELQGLGDCVSDVSSLIVDVERLNSINLDPKYLSLKHANFVGLPEVSVSLSKIQEDLLLLAAKSQGDLASYYELLALSIGGVTNPRTPSEIMYGCLVSELEIGSPVIRFSPALYDFNYGFPAGSDRRDTIFAIGIITDRYNVSPNFLTYVRDFLKINDDFEATIIDESLIHLGASQLSRSKISGQKPSGSSHVMNKPDGGKRIVVRRYADVVGIKVAETMSHMDAIFSEEFLSGNELHDRLISGHRWSLLSHEVAEAVGTDWLNGANRAMQECLYTATGFMGLKELNRVGELSDEDFINAKTYQLARIIMSLTQEYTGDAYTPGNALMYQTLIKNGAITISSGKIDNVDWHLFDESMDQIAVELRDTFMRTKDPLVNIESLPYRIQENDQFIRGIIEKNCQINAYPYA